MRTPSSRTRESNLSSARRIRLSNQISKRLQSRNTRIQLHGCMLGSHEAHVSYESTSHLTFISSPGYLKCAAIVSLRHLSQDSRTPAPRSAIVLWKLGQADSHVQRSYILRTLR